MIEQAIIRPYSGWVNFGLRIMVDLADSLNTMNAIKYTTETYGICVYSICTPATQMLKKRLRFAFHNRRSCKLTETSNRNVE
jgi:7-keto-8-aminopelargonate synthetase-like enzyme